MKKFLTLALIFVMVFSLSACGQEGSEEVAAKDSLVVQITMEPASLDPISNGTVEVAFITDQIYGKLVTFGEDGSPVGELAESWEFNDDCTQLTFKLRDGIKFSDGSDITSKDVAYSYSTEGAKTNTYLLTIESIDTPDDKTVVLNLSRPYSSMVNSLCAYGACVYPEGSQETVDIAKGATAYSGPYALEAWNLGENIVLTANPYWYEADSVAIKTVTYKFIGDENNALIALEAGDIDIMANGSGISQSAVETADASDLMSSVACNSATIWMLVPNFAVPQLADVNVRQAINYAIDRSAIMKVTGLGEVAGNYFAPSYFGDDFVEGHEGAAQDLDKAKEYLAKSGYPDGFTIKLQAPTMYMKAATVIQSELAEIGITVEIDEVDASAWVNNLISGNFELGCVTYGNMINDISGFYAMYEPGGVLDLCHTEDGTIYDGLTNAFTKYGAERHELLSGVADYCDEFLPYIGVFFVSSYCAYNSSLTFGPYTAAGYDCAAMHW